MSRKSELLAVLRDALPGDPDEYVIGYEPDRFDFTITRAGDEKEVTLPKERLYYESQRSLAALLADKFA